MMLQRRRQFWHVVDEGDVEEDEEDESRQLFAKVMLVGAVLEGVDVAEKGVAHRRRKRRARRHTAKRHECRVMGKVKDGSAQGHAHQRQLHQSVDLADGGRVDLSSGNRKVQVLLQSHRWLDGHVSDVETGVDEEEVSGDDERGQPGGDEVDVGQAQVEAGHQHLVGQRVQKAAQRRHLTRNVASYPTVQGIGDSGVSKDGQRPRIVAIVDDEVGNVRRESDPAQTQQVGNGQDVFSFLVARRRGLVLLNPLFLIAADRGPLLPAAAGKRRRLCHRHRRIPRLSVKSRQKPEIGLGGGDLTSFFERQFMPRRKRIRMDVSGVQEPVASRRGLKIGDFGRRRRLENPGWKIQPMTAAGSGGDTRRRTPTQPPESGHFTHHRGGRSQWACQSQKRSRTGPESRL